ncbi:MAG TPA: hypothetical protein VFP45_03380 [Candidatus Nitrosotalea sp.]|nr:hypothetical protein [Candidatus Nitrosotalea sp.]
MAEQQQVSNQKEVPRFVDAEDLDELEQLGWPLDEPEKYEVCVAGPDSKNPGRIFMKYGYFFAFWLDDPVSFDPIKFEREVQKRQMQQRRFSQREKMQQDPAIKAILERRKLKQNPPQ